MLQRLQNGGEDDITDTQGRSASKRREPQSPHHRGSMLYNQQELDTAKIQSESMKPLNLTLNQSELQEHNLNEKPTFDSCENFETGA